MPDRTTATVHQGGQGGYRHEAFFYADIDEFMNEMGKLVRRGDE